MPVLCGVQCHNADVGPLDHPGATTAKEKTINLIAVPGARTALEASR